MPAYHSAYNDPAARAVASLALLPVRSKVRGPAPLLPADDASDDIVDEALLFFRANCFFRNYEIQGSADRVLIYLTLFISDCLLKLAASVRGDHAPSYSDAQKALNTLAVGNFALPGDPSFPLNNMYEKPRDRAEADLMRQYLTQLRQELAIRLVDRIYSPTYPDTDGGKKPSKWWMCFQKRKFMNKSL